MEKITYSFFRVAIVISSIAIIFLALSGCTEYPAGGAIDQITADPGQTPVVMNSSATQSGSQGNENSVEGSNTTTSSAPVSITIHSAFKTMKIKDTNPISGNIFIVINTTIENLDETTPYIANETTVDITGGGPITQKVYGRLSNPFYWGSIPPKSSKTGEIVFGVKATTEQFTLTLRDEQGKTILAKPIGSIPLGTYDQSPVSDSTTQESASAQTLKVIIHSVQKTTKIQDTNPLPGNIYVVINMTIENLADSEPFVANENTIDITGGGPMTQKIYDRVANPFYWGSIPPGSSKTGEIVFGVKESTNQFTLTLLDEKKHVIVTIPIGTISTGPYLPSIGNTDLLSATNFSSVIESLDTPQKAAEYADARFIFTYHDGCMSYPPEEFFRIGKGDCKDYATFLSYALAHHGYDAQIVAFKYFKDNKRNGHVVTFFKDTDGSMYYMTTPAVSKMRWVTSIDDLLQKECSRLGIPTIANYTIVPAGSVDTCVV
jgi:hypothetical protein